MRSIFKKPKAGWKITARKWFPIAELPYKIGINIPIIQKGQADKHPGSLTFLLKKRLEIRYGKTNRHNFKPSV